MPKSNTGGFGQGIHNTLRRTYERMKITSKEYAIFLDDEKTGKSAVLRHDGAVWRLTTGDETHVYDDLDVAITYASRILADARVEKGKASDAD